MKSKRQRIYNQSGAATEKVYSTEIMPINMDLHNKMTTAKDFARIAAEMGIISQANESELELLMLHYMEVLRNRWFVGEAKKKKCNLNT